MASKPPDQFFHRIAELESMLNPEPKCVPLEFEEWIELYDMDNNYNTFYEEYGDSATIRSDYMEYHYKNYLNDFTNKLKYEE